MLEDLNLIGLGDFTSLITNINISDWGNKIYFECIYDPQGQQLPYKLIFSDCSSIKWQLHSPENKEDLEADLIDLQLGQNCQEKPAIIYTDIFEIAIFYGSFQVEKMAESKILEKVSI